MENSQVAGNFFFSRLRRTDGENVDTSRLKHVS